MNRLTARPPSMGQDLGIYPKFVFSPVVGPITQCARAWQIKSTIFVYFDVIAQRTLDAELGPKNIRGNRNFRIGNHFARVRISGKLDIWMISKS